MEYKHTQVGWIIIVLVGAGAAGLTAVMAISSVMCVPLSMLVLLLLVCLVLFCTLTVAVGEGRLMLSFGPGLIRKEIPLSEIESFSIVTNRWYYGWGIRYTPHGWLYNVSGFSALEVHLKTGKKMRIGTDAPQDLSDALRASLRALPAGSRG